MMRPMDRQLAEAALRKQDGACAECGARSEPGKRVPLRRVRRVVAGRREVLFVCRGEHPTYERPGMVGAELEAAVMAIAAADPGLVTFQAAGDIPSKRRRRRGRPARFPSLSHYERARQRVLDRIGANASKVALRRALRLRERTFFRYERALRDRVQA